MMGSPAAGLSRPPRSPISTKSTAAADSDTLIDCEEQLSTSGSAQAQQLAAQQAAAGTGARRAGARAGLAAETQHQVAGGSGRHDAASNGSSESCELENREAQKKPLHKKGSPVLRHVQSKLHIR